MKCFLKLCHYTAVMARLHTHPITISIVVSLLLVLTLGYIQHLQVNELKQNLSTTSARLQQQIDSQHDALAITAQQLTVEQQAREKADQTLTEHTATLDEQVSLVKNQNQETTKQLGQLNTNQEQSQQQLQELTDKVEYKLKSTDFTGIVKKVLTSVVSIQTDTSIGSGAIIDSKGYILTNYHVIDGARRGLVRTSNQQTHEVRIVQTDSVKDLAILKIEGDFTSLKFGNSDNVVVGQRVIAVGSPAGLEFSVNEGIISARRTIKGNEYFQTDVALNPGNSGGPLIDSNGKIIGINNFKLKGFEGLNFALSINEASTFVQQAIVSDT